MKKYNFYEDPAHGWLKVPIAELKAMGLMNSISQYSYMRAGYAYLEEDCDAQLFMTAKGMDPDKDIVNHIGDRLSRIRNYDRFNPRVELVAK